MDMQDLDSSLPNSLILGPRSDDVGYNLDDIKRASESTGADLIVFSDLHSKAAEARKQIEDRRDDRRKIEDSTKDIKKPKKKALSELTALTLALAKEKEVLEIIKSAESSFTAPIDEAISKLEGRISKVNSDIERYNEALDNLIKIAEDLIKYRSDERDAYKDAKSKYSDLKSDPEEALGSNPSDENKEQLEEYINNIVSKIESEESGHETQIKDLPNWKDNLAKTRNATKASEIPSD